MLDGYFQSEHFEIKNSINLKLPCEKKLKGRKKSKILLVKNMLKWLSKEVTLNTARLLSFHHLGNCLI